MMINEIAKYLGVIIKVKNEDDKQINEKGGGRGEIFILNGTSMERKERRKKYER